MFNMIPHVDARSAKGQRFDDWNSLRFFDPSRVVVGDPFIPSYSPGGRPLPTKDIPLLIAASGSFNVPECLPAGHIERVVIGCSQLPAFVKKWFRRERARARARPGLFPVLPVGTSLQS
jgi:hypothetical protein